jgi:hypothetical protein
MFVSVIRRSGMVKREREEGVLTRPSSLFARASSLIL